MVFTCKEDSVFWTPPIWSAPPFSFFIFFWTPHFWHFLTFFDIYHLDEITGWRTCWVKNIIGTKFVHCWWKAVLTPFYRQTSYMDYPLCFYKKILRILRPRNATSVILKNYVFANLRDINQKKRQKWKITCTNPTYQHPFGGVEVYIKEKFSFTVRKDLN